jgi:hydroxymethylbilane synthase
VSTSGKTMRIGTRGSALALAQTRIVAADLEKTGVTVELVIVTTEGDTSKASLASLGGTGVFASALREALLDGRCDAVVHSLKDLPTQPHPGLVIGATPKREDVRDALCARDGLTLDTLPAGAKVGTGSPRRRAQLRSRRPDLEVVDIRGNVDTRLGRVAVAADSDTALDAVILAAAGLSRLGRLEAVTEFLEIDAVLDHKPTRTTVEAEREVLALLEAGCAAPIGAHAMIHDGLLFLTTRVYALDGSESLTSSHALYLSDVENPASEVAEGVARELLDLGAATIAPLGAQS